MATRTPEETVKAYLHVGGHDPEACREFLAADFACVSELRPSFNADVFLARMELYRKSIPDIKLELGSWIISQGDTVVCEAMESGTFTGGDGWAATLRAWVSGSEVATIGPERMKTVEERCLDPFGRFPEACAAEPTRHRRSASAL